ncbi:MAG: prepilin-type N-terminal cleavage/methylation domain-containing protein [Planctomycetota bacterium]|nr:prepilin-type N-terminal cleavage/methylation domain-containing protein [Planctomycetota bacterium]
MQARTKKALTLVELLAALVITSLLVVAALRVSTHLARAEILTRRTREDSWSEARLRDLVTMDVAHTEAYQEDREGLVLWTSACLEAKTLELEHVPGKVAYRVQTVGNREWLVRSQESEWHPPVTELVGRGVKAVLLRAKDEDKPSAGERKALPAAATMAVEFDEEGRPPVQWTVRSRAIRG